MIHIEIKKGENIDKALKRYKSKVIKAKQLEQLRNKQEFVKKSVQNREDKLKAIYTSKTKSKDDN
jgi:small subunit ribosomal protein S21